MEFKPNYFLGIIKILLVSLLTSIIAFYFTGTSFYIWMTFLSMFIITLILMNKKWIKSVKIDSDNSLFIISYPFNIIGVKKYQFPFHNINKVTYYEYMSNTPAHFTVVFKDMKLRFDCSENESKKVSSILSLKGITTAFYHQKKEANYR